MCEPLVESLVFGYECYFKGQKNMNKEKEEEGKEHLFSTIYPRRSVILHLILWNSNRQRRRGSYNKDGFLPPVGMIKVPIVCIRHPQPHFFILPFLILILSFRELYRRKKNAWIFPADTYRVKYPDPLFSF